MDFLILYLILLAFLLIFNYGAHLKPTLHYRDSPKHEVKVTPSPKSKSQMKRIAIVEEGMGKDRRREIIEEIQAFASEYGHEVSKDGVTREVIIVQQLLDFLKEHKK